MVDFEATLRSSLAGYAIEREIGTGAMAVVFLALDMKHDRNVAIKVLRPELTSAIGADRFNREIEVVAGLTHPHILPLHDSGDVDGLLYYVMPYIAGGSLRDRLARDGRLPIPDATRITREIADALGFAHRRGVIHRDVKPANILLAEDHALLADFGIAHLAETEGGTLTGTGLTLGTPTYFSPEQATGEHDIDGRSDIYSLGCVLYETLTGEPPFTGPSVQALIAHHIVDEPPRAKQLRPDVSDGIEAVVQTALRKEPERRFQTAREMAGSLDLVSGGFEVMAARALRKLLGPRFRWLHGWRLALLAAAAAVLVIGSGLFFRSIRTRPAFGSAYPTYAVLPYRGEDFTEEENRLSTEGARRLYFHLLDWRSITVVDGLALEGPAVQVMQAGYGLPTSSLTAALQLAEKVNASHVIYVAANVWDDSVELAARVHASGELIPERTELEKGSKSEMELITAGLALGILQLHGEAAEHGNMVNRSPNHVAQQQAEQGREKLLDWRLAEAEEHFQAAVQADSGYALAHYYLAATMYWRTVQDEERLLDGPSIAYHALQADRMGVGNRLRPGERRKVDAFLSFWEGDYASARARYDTMLLRNPVDLEALVLAGAVEYHDPWLIEGRSGELVPRQNLNRARAVFDSAVGLNSHVQLAWGRLFDIDMDLARAVYEDMCYSFLPPGGPLLPPYEFRGGGTRFCPYVEGEVIRWKDGRLSEEQLEHALAGVRQLQAQTTDRLESWANVQRNQPRPHEELADWMQWERAVLGCDVDPVWADSLLHGARVHFEAALQFRGDTTPEDRVRLAMLLLATDDLAEALAQTDRGLAELGDWRGDTAPPPRLEAANVYMAAGRGESAAAVLERVWSEGSFSVADPESEDGSLDGGSVQGSRWALGALGITASEDSSILRRFVALERAWADYTDRQRALLKSSSTSLSSPALVRLPDLWDSWFEGWEEYGLEVPAVWKGLRTVAADPAVARLHLEEAVGMTLELDDSRAGAYQFYMPIVLAERLGEDSIATELKHMARACPLRLDGPDLGWGMTGMLTDTREE